MNGKGLSSKSSKDRRKMVYYPCGVFWNHVCLCIDLFHSTLAVDHGTDVMTLRSEIHDAQVVKTHAEVSLGYDACSVVRYHVLYPTL